MLLRLQLYQLLQQLLWSVVLYAVTADFAKMSQPTRCAMHAFMKYKAQHPAPGSDSESLTVWTKLVRCAVFDCLLATQQQLFGVLVFKVRSERVLHCCHIQIGAHK